MILIVAQFQIYSQMLGLWLPKIQARFRQSLLNCEENIHGQCHNNNSKQIGFSFLRKILVEITEIRCVLPLWSGIGGCGLSWMGQCQRHKQRGDEDNTAHCLMHCDFGVTDLEKMKRKGLKVQHTSNYCQIHRE